MRETGGRLPRTRTPHRLLPVTRVPVFLVLAIGARVILHLAAVIPSVAQEEPTPLPMVITLFMVVMVLVLCALATVLTVAVPLVTDTRVLAIRPIMELNTTFISQFGECYLQVGSREYRENLKDLPVDLVVLSNPLGCFAES